MPADDAPERAPTPTLRPVAPGLEARLGHRIDVLDHGFIRVIDYMGDDAAVVQAARVSYGKGTKAVREDRGLIRYLMRHRHTTPFEMCELKLHVKLPIFVARQWIRHRMASVNEASARYSVLDREFYLPRPEDLATQSRDNKQGRGEALSAEAAAEVLRLLEDDALRVHRTYTRLMDEHQLARELARMDLGLNTYTQWYWKIDLHNLLHFLALRMDAHAQWEIRAYADQIGALVADWVPLCWEAFRDYRLGALTLSRGELDVLRAMLRGEAPDPEAAGLSPREWRALRAALGLDA
ncbi:MAG: FAD-dependent thymidylate synthase [Deltaproteobacteria bacterium]|nr:FAD-dependent thymidylate synthase [Deltaproteobacteria bacterium]